MKKEEKLNLRKDILEIISQYKNKTLSDLAEILAYVTMDIGLASFGLAKVTQEEIQKIVDKQETEPTLSGALVTQAVLMMDWNHD